MVIIISSSIMLCGGFNYYIIILCTIFGLNSSFYYLSGKIFGQVYSYPEEFLASLISVI